MFFVFNYRVCGTTILVGGNILHYQCFYGTSRFGAAGASRVKTLNSRFQQNSPRESGRDRDSKNAKAAWSVWGAVRVCTDGGSSMFLTLLSRRANAALRSWSSFCLEQVTAFIFFLFTGFFMADHVLWAQHWLCTLLTGHGIRPAAEYREHSCFTHTDYTKNRMYCKSTVAWTRTSLPQNMISNLTITFCKKYQSRYHKKYAVASWKSQYYSG